MRHTRRLPFHVFALLLASFSLNAMAFDASVAARLDARGVKYTVDEDGDYRVVTETGEGRTQLAYVSGTTQSVGGFTIREVFSPAAFLDRDGIDGDKALELLAESRLNKFGAWETAGNALYFVIKLPDNVDAAQLETAMEIAAQVADSMESELSGDIDDL
jgi:hypothetical protein